MTKGKSNRQEANAKAPCLVCEATRGCSIGADGLILCRGAKGEVQGFRYLGQAKGDPQWGQYRVDQGESLRPPHSHRGSSEPVPRNRPKTSTVEKKTVWVMDAQKYQRDLTPEKRKLLAANLGLPVECLDSLFYVGWVKDKWDGPCWTFPEQNGRGEIIGITKRSYKGVKKAFKTAGRGLTIPRNWEEQVGPIFVVEGASCTLALAAMGLTGIGRFSNVGGVSHLVELLENVPADREIIVMGEWDAKPDGEWPGLVGSTAVAGALAEQLMRPIKWALPPDHAKDVRKWVNNHLKDHTLASAALLLGQQFVDLLQPEVVYPPATKEEEEGVVFRTADKIEPKVYSWLVPNFVPLCDLLLIAGHGAVGKGLLTVEMAACLTRGEPAFGLDYSPPAPKHVVIMACEDDISAMLYPRLRAAGAVLSRVHIVEGVRGKDKKLIPFNLGHLELLKQKLEQVSDLGLVLIDPVAAYLSGTGINPGRDEEVRTITEPLRWIAHNFRVCIGMVKHFNKGDSPRASNLIADGAVWRNACRAVYVVFPDDQAENRFLFLQNKIQGAAPQNGFMYHIRQAPADRIDAALASLPPDWTEEDRQDFVKQMVTVEWCGESDRDSNAVAAALASAAAERPGETDGPAEFLKRYLENGPAMAESAVIAGNTSLSINRPVRWWRERVLKARLAGFSLKGRFQGAPWYFCLPNQEPPSSLDYDAHPATSEEIKEA